MGLYEKLLAFESKMQHFTDGWNLTELNEFQAGFLDLWYQLEDILTDYENGNCG